VYGEPWRYSQHLNLQTPLQAGKHLRLSTQNILISSVSVIQILFGHLGSRLFQCIFLCYFSHHPSLGHVQAVHQPSRHSRFLFWCFLWQWIDELLLSVFQTLISSCPVALQGDITLSDGDDCIIQLSVSVLSSTPKGVIGPISGFSDWVVCISPNCVCPLSS